MGFLTTPEQRARQLLLEHLLPVQREDYEENAGFNIRASNGALFRLHHMKCVHNNIVSESARVYGVWPFFYMPGGILPMDDVLLSQKLGLESDRCQYMLRIACKMSIEAVSGSTGPMWRPTDYDKVI